MKHKSILIAGFYMAAISAALILLGMNLPGSGTAKMLVYQTCILVLSVVSLTVLRIVVKRPLAYLRAGAIGAPGERMRLFMVKAGTSWKTTGSTMLIVMTGATGAFMVLGMTQAGLIFDPAKLLANLHWVLLFSIVNTWSEEIFYRLVPAEIMEPAPRWFPLLSAVIFGAAHFWGNPGGPVGILMAGLLGYVLARSVAETRGMFWAFGVHLAQDFVIFGVLFGFGMFA